MIRHPRFCFFAVFMLVAQLRGPCAMASDTIEMTDSMTLSPSRNPGQSLVGKMLETGSAAWLVDGSIVVGDDGATSTKATGGTLFHAIPTAVGRHHIAVEICPASLESCAGLAFCKSSPAGNFFGASELQFLFTRSGGYAIEFKDVGIIKQGSKADYPTSNQMDSINSN